VHSSHVATVAIDLSNPIWPRLQAVGLEFFAKVNYRFIYRISA